MSTVLNHYLQLNDSPFHYFLEDILFLFNLAVILHRPTICDLNTYYKRKNTLYQHKLYSNL